MAIATIMVTTVTVATMAIKGKIKASPLKITANGKNYGKPDHVDSDISFSRARSLAVNYGLVGYQALPPGIAKNVARGKPLPPGIAKKTLPASMINDLPYYPGYEWRAVGDDLVLVALSTAIVTAVINGVFD
ncbi:Putative inner membrane protein [Klebsiella pneumoniae]|nr:Putative inner membrane protein [Klebsiella pneumoniae]